MRIPSLLIATTLGLLVGVVASGCGSDDSGTGGSAGTAGSGGTAGAAGSTGGTGGETGGAAGSTGGSAGTAGTAGTAGNAGEGGSAGAAGGNCMAVDVSNFVLAGLYPDQPASYFLADVSPNIDEADPEVFQIEFYDESTGSISLTSAGVNDNYETCMQCALLRADVSDAATGKFYFQSAGTIDIDATVGPMSGGFKATITDLTLVEVTIDETTYTSTPVANGACITVNGPVQIDIAPPPDAWTCDPTYYGAADGCDCDCGAYDPDCDDATQTIYGCQDGQTCVDPGVCDGIPTGWTCDDTAFADGATCNCECGAFDPDCANDTLPIAGCDAGDTCGTGVCLPAGWTCDADYYMDGQGCDCNCGAYDPDCDDATQTVYGCQAGQTCADPGVCEGLPTAWTCDDTAFADGATCNCECGAFDPDCANDALPIAGCDTGDTCGTGVCLPAAWTCDPTYYVDTEYCDCECGAWDPDCDDTALPIDGCATGQTCVDPGVCQ